MSLYIENSQKIWYNILDLLYLVFLGMKKGDKL